MIISTPIDFPIIQPDDWDEWWSVWNSQAKLVKKNATTVNKFSVKWQGFDIYVRPGSEKGASFHYNFENINRPDLFSNLFNNLENFPVHIKSIRAACSLEDVPAHRDHRNDMYAVRSMLYNTNPIPTWYYKIDDRKEYLKLPNTTNTWLYGDHTSEHGTDFIPGHTKILLMFFGPLKEGFLDQILKTGDKKFKDYTIYK